MQIIKHYYSYNNRRYSRPWVCGMTPDGKHDFKNRIGTFSGNDGEEGDLVIFDPVPGAIYGYGQKDYRGKNTEVRYVKWDGEKFQLCDKLGRIKEA